MQHIYKHNQQFIMLPALLLLPLFGALLLCTYPSSAVGSGSTPTEESRVKNVALVTSLATFVLSMVM
jgi:NADH:ubiquinone oxidoreductase subunit 4 (subunit M)